MILSSSGSIIDKPLIRHNGGFGIVKTSNFHAKRHGDTCSKSGKGQ